VETGQTDEALVQARDLVNRNGENETTLFLLARTANAAHSRQEEIDALARLVSVAQSDHQPLGASLTYLGQAYAKDGQRGNALRTLQQAILAPELTGEERKQIRDVMDHLMEGNASSTTLPSLPTSPENTNP
jgi:lipopolysaccharide biosynthesis regulator YciM